MKSILQYATMFGLGYLTYQFSPLLKQSKNTDNQHHSFKQLMEEKEYVEPKVLEFIQQSKEKHFLHSMIAQNNDALKTFKIYFPSELEQKAYSNTLCEDDKYHLNLIFNATDQLQGHNQIVHGGMLATLIESAFGQLSFLASGLTPTATAHLNIDYKKPVKCNQDYMIECSIDKIENRKVYMKATIYDHNKQICTMADGLFVTVSWGGQKWKDALEKVKQTNEWSEKLLGKQ